MVRKWSYIKSKYSLILISKLMIVHNCYIFKIFRLTTRFKKYNRYKTKFLRKNFFLRKRKTTWLTLLSLFTKWSLNYLLNKHYICFYQNLSLFYYSFLLPHIQFFKIFLEKYSTIFIFNSLFISKNFIKIFININYYLPSSLIQIKNISNILKLNWILFMFKNNVINYKCSRPVVPIKKINVFIIIIKQLLYIYKILIKTIFIIKIIT